MADSYAKTAFETCIRNGRLKPVEPEPDKLEEEIQKAVVELRYARDCYAEAKHEECVVQAFFSMNRTLRVLLQRLGYRDTNVYSMVVALDYLYVQPGRLAPHLLDILKLARDQKDLLRGGAGMGARCGRKETRLVLAGAEETMEVAREELALGRIPELDGPPGELEEPGD